MHARFSARIGPKGRIAPFKPVDTVHILNALRSDIEWIAGGYGRRIILQAIVEEIFITDCLKHRVFIP